MVLTIFVLFQNGSQLPGRQRKYPSVHNIVLSLLIIQTLSVINNRKVGSEDTMMSYLVTASAHLVLLTGHFFFHLFDQCYPLTFLNERVRFGKNANDHATLQVHPVRT